MLKLLLWELHSMRRYIMKLRIGMLAALVVAGCALSACGKEAAATGQIAMFQKRHSSEYQKYKLLSISDIKMVMGVWASESGVVSGTIGKLRTRFPDNPQILAFT